MWDAEAPTFDDETDHGLGDPAARAAWRRVLRDALPQTPSRIADLGCGTGSLSVLLAEEGHRVDGIDFSPEMVMRAEAKAKAHGVDVSFTVEDAGTPKLPTASYDVVLSRHVLWALPDPVDALGRWTNLLAPGGRLVLVEGFWPTNAGLHAVETQRMVKEHRSSTVVTLLADPVLWSKRIEDERYLSVSEA